jgi:TRAP-type C4-dicarboxylate transport system permease small subunit
MHIVKKIVYKIADVFGVVSALGYLGIVVICIFDVILEKLGHPLPGSTELVERAMLVAVFASFAYAQAKKAHINMMIVVERVPRIARLLILGLTSILSVATTAYAASAAWTMRGTALELNQITGILHIPLWPFYLLESLAMWFFAIILLVDTLFVFVAIKDDKINEEVIDEYGMLLPGREIAPVVEADDIPIG